MSPTTFDETGFEKILRRHRFLRYEEFSDFWISGFKRDSITIQLTGSKCILCGEGTEFNTPDELDTYLTVELTLRPVTLPPKSDDEK